jgi:hypothetical protein
MVELSMDEIDAFWKSRAGLLYATKLRGGLFHTTTPDGYRGILKDRAILPNDGSRQWTFPQSANSVATRLRAVSLFDFRTATEKECISQALNWRGFFFFQKVTVALRLSDRIRPRLISNEKAFQLFGMSAVQIPFVEVWHPEPISISSIVGKLVVVDPHFGKAWNDWIGRLQEGVEDGRISSRWEK